jgi:signal transduction histidine kinase
LNGLHNDFGAALLRAGAGTEACAGQGDARSPGAVWALIRTRVTWIQVLTAALAALVVVEFIRPVAIHAPALRATAESLITLLALLGALLLRAQFGHTRRLRDLILLGTLVLFTLVELTSAALPASLEIHSGGQFGAATKLGQLFVAATIAAAAFTSPNKLVAGYRRSVAIVATLSLVAFAAAELGGLLAGGALVVVTAHPSFGIGAAIDRPLAFAVMLITGGVLGCGAAQFTHRGHVERDGAMSLLAGAVVLMMAAQLYFLALPWSPYAWISPGEGLRLLAVALIVAAAARQEHAVRAGMMRAAAIAERRRVARDLHDGLAQDLAFIALHGTWLAEEFGDEHPLTIAAKRALALSRGTISDLSDLRSTTVRDALESIAHELRDRFPMAIAVDADVRADLPSKSREHVLRIAREAIANAGRHGHAKNVLVSLRQTRDGLALRVRDDGCGIRGAAPAHAPEGFGLCSMRERADALGGRLTVRQRNGGGTELEVIFP